MQPSAEKSWNSYADYFKASAYSVFPQEHRHAPGRLACRLILAEMGLHDNTDPDVPDLVLSMPLDVEEDGFWSWNMGDGWVKEPLMAGQIVTMPPHTTSTWQARGRRRNLVALIPTSTINRVLGSACPPDLTSAFLPLTCQSWNDTLVQGMLRRLWQASAREQMTDHLLSDGLVVSILLELLQRAGTIEKPTTPLALAPARLRRVVDFVEQNLHRPIDVVDMAGIAELSLRHFARAFRQETGETPHRWLMERRLNRAKAMLLAGAEDCRSIALNCGFASQSHLTVALKKATGMTPRHWRHVHEIGAPRQ